MEVMYSLFKLNYYEIIYIFLSNWFNSLTGYRASDNRIVIMKWKACFKTIITFVLALESSSTAKSKDLVTELPET
jgi:hypothetical protein